jgi:hypothetical protein
MGGRALLAAGLMLVGVSAFGQTRQPGWIVDPRTGCRAWDANPQPNEAISWSGDCRNGFAQGHGVLQWFQGGRPVAEAKGWWRSGKMHGHGVVRLANGERYDGRLVNDLMNGHGVYVYANGDRYDGEYRNDRKDGRGVYTYANGGRYDGAWRDGMKSGRGTEIRADGSRYDGSWRNDLPNGLGTAVWLNGERYAGLWVMGCFRDSHRVASWGVDLDSCE